MPNSVFIFYFMFNLNLFYFAENGNFEGSVLAGSGKQGEEDGTPELCSFNRPYGIAFDPTSNLCFVADYRGHTTRMLTPSTH